MPLSERNLEIVRTLVEQAPDAVVGGLSQALAQTAADSPLGNVKRLVDGEVADRTLRNRILQPLLPMFADEGVAGVALTFPARTLPALWRAVKAREPDAVDRARVMVESDAEAHKQDEALNAVLRAAAARLREAADAEFRAVCERVGDGRAEGAALLSSCLEIGPVVRRASQRLSQWIVHPGAETSAAVKLAYRDAVAIAEDAGPLFFQMLAAQLDEPWMIMRIISAVMGRPTERYLRESELSGFPEALIDGVDRQIQAIADLDGVDGPAAGRAAAQTAEQAVHEIMELENAMDLPRERGWGLRIHKQRARLAAVVEAQLRAAEAAVMAALPLHAPRAKVRHQQLLLTHAPDARLTAAAMTLLSFADALRTTANYGGFSTARSRMVEKLGEYLDHYVDGVIDLVRCDEADDRGLAAAFLDQAAEFSLLVRGERAAELVRRQAQAALSADGRA